MFYQARRTWIWGSGLFALILLSTTAFAQLPVPFQTTYEVIEVPGLNRRIDLFEGMQSSKQLIFHSPIFAFVETDHPVGGYPKIVHKVEKGILGGEQLTFKLSISDSETRKILRDRIAIRRGLEEFDLLPLPIRTLKITGPQGRKSDPEIIPVGREDYVSFKMKLGKDVVKDGFSIKAHYEFPIVDYDSVSQNVELDARTKTTFSNFLSSKHGADSKFITQKDFEKLNSILSAELIEKSIVSNPKYIGQLFSSDDFQAILNKFLIRQDIAISTLIADSGKREQLTLYLKPLIEDKHIIDETIRKVKEKHAISDDEETRIRIDIGKILSDIAVALSGEAPIAVAAGGMSGNSGTDFENTLRYHFEQAFEKETNTKCYFDLKTSKFVVDTINSYSSRDMQVPITFVIKKSLFVGKDSGQEQIKSVSEDVSLVTLNTLNNGLKSWPNGDEGPLKILNNQEITLLAGSIKNYSSILIESGGKLKIIASQGPFWRNQAFFVLGCSGDVDIQGEISYTGLNHDGREKFFIKLNDIDFPYIVEQSPGGPGGNSKRHGDHGPAEGGKPTKPDGYGGGGGGGHAYTKEVVNGIGLGGDGAVNNQAGMHGREINGQPIASDAPNSARHGIGGNGSGGGGGGHVQNSQGDGTRIYGGAGGNGGMKGLHGGGLIIFALGEIRGNGKIDVSGSDGTAGQKGNFADSWDVRNLGLDSLPDANINEKNGYGYGGGGGGGGAGGSGGFVWLVHKGGCTFPTDRINISSGEGGDGREGGAGFNPEQPEINFGLTNRDWWGEDGKKGTDGKHGGFQVIQIQKN